MSNLRQLRTRIKSSKSTAKVTKAMEMVAASKMRRAQDQAKSAGLYTEGISQIVLKLGGSISPEENVFFRISPKIKKICIVVYGPSRGFCGSLSANLAYSLRTFVKDLEAQNVEIDFVTVMKMAYKVASKMGHQIKAHFTEFDEYPKVQSIYQILDVVRNDFKSGIYDEVYIAYPRFVSTAVQIPEIIKVLPVDPSVFIKPSLEKGGEVIETKEPKESSNDGKSGFFLLEPSKKEILNRLVPEYIEMRFFNSLLSTKASEHSARMLVMRNATDNAEEMIYDLTLKFNKTRQAQITTEIIETSGRL